MRRGGEGEEVERGRWGRGDPEGMGGMEDGRGEWVEWGRRECIISLELPRDLCDLEYPRILASWHILNHEAHNSQRVGVATNQRIAWGTLP